MDEHVFRCLDCAEIVGVYEPLVVMSEAGPRLTSRAAEPDLPALGRYLHRNCLEARGALASPPPD